MFHHKGITRFPLPATQVPTEDAETVARLESPIPRVAQDPQCDHEHQDHGEEQELPEDPLAVALTHVHEEGRPHHAEEQPEIDTQAGLGCLTALMRRAGDGADHRPHPSGVYGMDPRHLIPAAWLTA